ncbi:hypothetical protein [Paraburkholderia aspalathi]|uniref:hypothetical protein n=1 Tax=Paraburkholderia aspalathi TaxID=1324617 RepID=UPI0038B6F79E
MTNEMLRAALVSMASTSQAPHYKIQGAIYLSRRQQLDELSHVYSSDIDVFMAGTYYEPKFIKALTDWKKMSQEKRDSYNGISRFCQRRGVPAKKFCTYANKNGTNDRGDKYLNNFSRKEMTSQTPVTPSSINEALKEWGGMTVENRKRIGLGNFSISRGIKEGVFRNFASIKNGISPLGMQSIGREISGEIAEKRVHGGGNNTELHTIINGWRRVGRDVRGKVKLTGYSEILGRSLVSLSKFLNRSGVNSRGEDFLKESHVTWKMLDDWIRMTKAQRENKKMKELSDNYGISISTWEKHANLGGLHGKGLKVFRGINDDVIIKILDARAAGWKNSAKLMRNVFSESGYVHPGFEVVPQLIVNTREFKKKNATLVIVDVNGVVVITYDARTGNSININDLLDVDGRPTRQMAVVQRRNDHYNAYIKYQDDFIFNWVEEPRSGTAGRTACHAGRKCVLSNCILVPIEPSGYCMTEAAWAALANTRDPGEVIMGGRVLREQIITELRTGGYEEQIAFASEVADILPEQSSPQISPDIPGDVFFRPDASLFDSLPHSFSSTVDIPDRRDSAAEDGDIDMVDVDPVHRLKQPKIEPLAVCPPHIPVYVEAPLDQARTEFLEEISVCDLRSDDVQWSYETRNSNVQMIRHDMEPDPSHDDAFPLRDPTDVRRVHPFYARADGMQCDPAVRVVSVKLGQGMRHYVRSIAAAPEYGDYVQLKKRHELTNVFTQLERHAQLELTRLIAGQKAEAPICSVRRLTSQDLPVHEEQLVGQHGLFVHAAPDGTLPTVSRGRLLGFFAGARISTEKEFEVHQNTYGAMAVKRYEMDLPPGPAILASPMGFANSMAFANTSLAQNSPSPTYDFARINAIFVNLDVTLTDRLGKKRMEKMVAVLGYDNLVADQEVRVNYGEAYLAQFDAPNNAERIKQESDTTSK